MESGRESEREASDFAQTHPLTHSRQDAQKFNGHHAQFVIEEREGATIKRAFCFRVIRQQETTPLLPSPSHCPVVVKDAAAGQAAGEIAQKLCVHTLPLH